MAARYLLLLVVRSTAANKWSQIYRSVFLQKLLPSYGWKSNPDVFLVCCIDFDLSPNSAHTLLLQL